jgi:hypothetical protein
MILVAWVSMLMISDLPNILIVSFFGNEPEWLILAKVGLLGIFLGLCLARKAIRPLWQYALVMMVLFVASGSSTRLGNTDWWQSIYGGSQVSFTMGYLGIYVRDLGIALAVIATLWILKRRRKEFYLVKGQIDAPIQPVRWLGIREGGS